VVAGNEVHQPEVERLDAGQGGNLPDLAQRAVGFDQNVYRNPAVDAMFAFDVAQGFELDFDIFGRAGLGQGDEGQAVASATDQDFEVLLPVRVGDVVNPHADPVEAVVGTVDHGGDHFRVLTLGTGVGAILAVAGDVEDRAELVLQLQGLLHQLFRARVVIDRRQDREGLFAREQNLFGMAHASCQDRVVGCW